MSFKQGAVFSVPYVSYLFTAGAPALPGYKILY